VGSSKYAYFSNKNKAKCRPSEALRARRLKSYAFEITQLKKVYHLYIIHRAAGWPIGIVHQSFSDPAISSDSDSYSDWSPKFGLGLKKSRLSYTLTQNYQSVNRLFSEKTFSFIWYVFSTSSAFSVVLNWYGISTFCEKKTCALDSESEGFSKSEFFGLGLGLPKSSVVHFFKLTWTSP
jgi:hypothetical protein